MPDLSLPHLFSYSPIILPVISLVIWTLVIQGLMLITRLPAMTAAGMHPQEGARTADLAAKLPAHVQWKADNYNHLMEQPTIFYATALALAISGLGEGLNLWMAWLYFVSRVVHSLVHVSINKVLIRFVIFAIGSAALAVMAVNGMIQLL